MAFWRWVEPDLRNYALASVDLVLAGVFFQMSRGRWFPAPLFFLHAALVLQYAYAVLVGAEYFWIALVINRVFELEIAYVCSCALFRIRAFGQNEKGAPLTARLWDSVLQQSSRTVSPSDGADGFSRRRDDRRRKR